jgi:hypothetical protein
MRKMHLFLNECVGYEEEDSIQAVRMQYVFMGSLYYAVVRYNISFAPPMCNLSSLTDKIIQVCGVPTNRRCTV